MVKIRLSRQGSKKNLQYKVVVMDSNKKRDGAYLDILGYYYPHAKLPTDKLKVDREMVQKWVSKGAQPSKTFQKMLLASH